MQKTSNPEGYSANVSAWSSALTRASLAGQLPLEQRLILQTSDDLLNALASSQYGRPSGLGCVLDDCVQHGKMVDLHDFLASDKSIYHRSWIPSPWAVLRWSLRQVGIMKSGSYDVEGRLRKGSLVLVPALEEVWKKLSNAHEAGAASLTDRIVSREGFIKEVNGLVQASLSKQDISVLLRYLARDKHLLSYDDTTVKFKSPTASLPEPISHEDRSIASLKTLISNLTAQTTTLTTRIATLQSAASTAVKSGNKASALSALRSKKLAERNLQSRLDMLHQLEEVYTKIEAAANQVEIVAAMESSASVLKSLNKKVGGVEKVEDVLEGLREEMDKVDEVGGVLVEPLDGRAVLDEAQVDEELEAMEREEKRRVEEKQAEETRKRLAELESAEAQAEKARREKEQQEKGQKVEQDGRGIKRTEDVDTDTDAALEEALSTSVERLQRLDIEGPRDDERRQVVENAS